MGTIEKTIFWSMVAIIMFLVLTNAEGFAKAISAIGNNSKNLITALQGRG